MTRTAHPESLAEPAAAHFGARPLRLAVVGYTVAREVAHVAWVEALLDALIDVVTPARLGVVTSPTTRAGSVDRLATWGARRRGVPVLHVTCKAFEKAARADEISDRIERSAWRAVPRFVLPGRADYAEAGAVASNALLMLGGGPQSTMDFACAVRRGHRVAVALDAQLTAPPWDVARKRPAHAARYVAEQRDAWRDGTTAPWPDLACVSAKQRALWPEGWAARVGVFRDAPVVDIARAIGAFLDDPVTPPPRDAA
jgi:hypothetical protein